MQEGTTTPSPDPLVLLVLFFQDGDSGCRCCFEGVVARLGAYGHTGENGAKSPSQAHHAGVG